MKGYDLAKWLIIELDNFKGIPFNGLAHQTKPKKGFWASMAKYGLLKLHQEKW